MTDQRGQGVKIPLSEAVARHIGMATLAGEQIGVTSAGWHGVWRMKSSAYLPSTWHRLDIILSAVEAQTYYTPRRGIANYLKKR